MYDRFVGILGDIRSLRAGGWIGGEKVGRLITLLLILS